MKLIARNTWRDAGGSRVEARGIAHDPLLDADNRFRRYSPMDKHEVRQADITSQSYIEQARRTREMLRSMKPETVKQVIEFHKDLTVFEALALAQREGKLIVPNDVHDRILTETGDEKYLRENYPVWTGTLIIYEALSAGPKNADNICHDSRDKAPDKPFGKEVVFSWKDDKDVEYSISFKVPKQFRGKRNCALVVEHPDFELISLGNNHYELKVDIQNVHQIEQFPRRDGWYVPDAETMIPQGNEVKESSDSRYILRLNNSSYLGPVARGFSLMRFVGLSGRSSLGLGVVLMPLVVAPKKSDSHD